MSDPVAIKVEVRRYQPGICNGNIIWDGTFRMRGGVFPKDHPVAPGPARFEDQCGNTPSMVAFRQRGYWASCFPEGDGITFKPLVEKTHEQTVQDVRECFGFEVKPEPKRRGFTV